MQLKVNYYEFDINNNDYIIETGQTYLCKTLRHLSRYKNWCKFVPTYMSKKQFNELKKLDKIVEWIDCPYKSKYPDHYKFWKFNVE